MPMLRVALLVVCLAAQSLLAETPVAPPARPALAVVETPAPEADEKAPVVVAPNDHKFSMPAGPSRRLVVGTESDVNGGHGDLLLDNGTAPASGVLLRALSATPDIFLKLGTQTVSSSFNVLDANDASLFRVRGDGYAILRRDQDAFTGIEINNANPGTASVTASKQLRFFAGGVQTAAIASVGSGSTSATGGANALQLWNFTNAPMVFGTNNTERMRIHSDGSVAIGSTTLPGKLAVRGSTGGTPAIQAAQIINVPATISQNDYGVYGVAANTVPVGVANNWGVIGVVGEGWNYGPGTVAFASGGSFIGGNYSATTGNVTFARGAYFAVRSSAGTVGTGYGIYIADTEATNDYGIYQYGANDTNYFAGNVVIGGPPTTANTYALAVQGNANFNGTVTGNSIQAHYQDVAEWVPATSDLTPGTVVILNRGRNNEVMASSTAYDTAVAGVVSAQPGISLGIGGEGKEQIATTGRVKVRVDARTSPITVGDLLVTSTSPGMAMRSTPIEIGGQSLHKPGTIIGKALEPLTGGVGEILVLLSMQ